MEELDTTPYAEHIRLHRGLLRLAEVNKTASLCQLTEQEASTKSLDELVAVLEGNMRVNRATEKILLGAMLEKLGDSSSITLPRIDLVLTTACLSAYAAMFHSDSASRNRSQLGFMLMFSKTKLAGPSGHISEDVELLRNVKWDAEDLNDVRSRIFVQGAMGRAVIRDQLQLALKLGRKFIQYSEREATNTGAKLEPSTKAIAWGAIAAALNAAETNQLQLEESEIPMRNGNQLTSGDATLERLSIECNLDLAALRVPPLHTPKPASAAAFAWRYAVYAASIVAGIGLIRWGLYSPPAGQPMKLDRAVEAPTR